MLSNMSYCKPGCGTWHRFSPSQNSFVDSQVDCLKAALREAVNHYIMASAHVCHIRFVTIWQGLDEIVNVGRYRCRFDLCLSGVRPAISDVLIDRGVEQERGLLPDQELRMLELPPRL